MMPDCHLIISAMRPLTTANPFLKSFLSFFKTKRGVLTDTPGAEEVTFTNTFLMEYTYTNGPDEQFQISEKDADRLRASFNSSDTFFHFTVRERRCAVNLRLAHFIKCFPGQNKPTLIIQGIHIHISGQTKSRDIEPTSRKEVSEFFEGLESNARFLKVGDYYFPREDIVLAAAAEKFSCNEPG
jgi:hypothetical protein